MREWTAEQWGQTIGEAGEGSCTVRAAAVTAPGGIGGEHLAVEQPPPLSSLCVRAKGEGLGGGGSERKGQRRAG